MNTCRGNGRHQPRTPAEVMDERDPGESFCANCPDHEACMSGYPCSLVKRVNGDPA